MPEMRELLSIIAFAPPGHGIAYLTLGVSTRL
jgi:hypothetical protein